MFVVYKITSPKGKSYIGITIKGIEHRVNQHFKNAENHRDKSPLIENAIRKYIKLGMSMTYEILMTCDYAWELPKWEIAYIEEYNTLTPNGYNLSKGGDGNSTKHTDEWKREKSKAMRKNRTDEVLEMYVKPTVTASGTEGYIVQNPKYKSFQYCSPNMSMEEKRNLANECARNLEKGIVDTTNRYKHVDIGYNNIPVGITYLSRFDGFKVSPPGKPTKWLKSKKLTRDQKYQLALQYYYE